MHIYYAVMIAMVVGAAVGAGAVTALNAQSTPKAYIVTEVDVTGNMDVFLKDYAAHVQATVDPFGGRYLVRGGRNVGVEGDPPKGRIVISVFDSFEKAQAWRDSPEYKKIAAGARARGEVAHVHRRGPARRAVSEITSSAVRQLAPRAEGRAGTRGLGTGSTQ